MVLEKTIYARDTSKAVGSEARGEGMERGNLIVTTAKPPVAQRAGRISLCISIHILIRTSLREWSSEVIH